MKHIEIPFKTIPTINQLPDGRKEFVTYVCPLDIPDDIPNANVRAANVEKRDDIVKGIDDTLRNNPEDLAILSNGVSFTASKVEFDDSKIHLYFDEFKNGEGENKGGHIVKQCKTSQYATPRAVLKLQIWEGLDSELAVKRAVTTNLNRAMTYMIQESHNGTFAPLRSILSNQPYVGQIAWKANAPGEKPQDLIVELGIFACSGMNDGLTEPKRIYWNGKSKGTFQPMLTNVFGRGSRIVEYLDVMDFAKYHICNGDYPNTTRPEFGNRELGRGFRVDHKNQTIKLDKNNDKVRITASAIPEPLIFCQDVYVTESKFALEKGFWFVIAYGLGEGLINKTTGEWKLGSIERTKEFIKERIVDLVNVIDNKLILYLTKRGTQGRTSATLIQYRTLSEFAKDSSVYNEVAELFINEVEVYQREQRRESKESNQALATM